MTDKEIGYTQGWKDCEAKYAKHIELARFMVKYTLPQIQLGGLTKYKILKKQVLEADHE
jgi:hypothetical protein